MANMIHRSLSVLFCLSFVVSGALGFAPGLFLSSQRRGLQSLSPRGKVVGNVKHTFSSSARMASLVENNGGELPQLPTMNDTIAFAAVPSEESFALDASSTTNLVVEEVFDYVVEQTSTTSSLASFWEQPSVLVGRGLALLAAAVYGTNFAAVKILNDSLPVSLAASLRFGIGFFAMAAAVLWSERNRDAQEAGDQYFQVYGEAGQDVIPVSKAELYKERADAMWAGAEVGLWYAVGYIVQAIALLEVDASKVSIEWEGTQFRRGTRLGRTGYTHLIFSRSIECLFQRGRNFGSPCARHDLQGQETWTARHHFHFFGNAGYGLTAAWRCWQRG